MLGKIGDAMSSPRKKAEETPYFKPVVGSIHIDVWWKEGMALPRFEFLSGAWPYNRPCAQQYVGKSQSCMVISGRICYSEYNDNAVYKEGGCGIEGWLWKRSNDTFSSWQRRWVWVETVPEPALCYYQEVASEAEMEKLGR